MCNGHKLEIINKYGVRWLRDTEERKESKVVSWFSCPHCNNEFLGVKCRVLSKIQPRQSCGCQHGKWSIKDIARQKFTRLMAICATSERRGNREVVWLCYCECGNYKHVRIGDLTSGNTKSCGCLNIEVTLSRVKDKHQNWNPNITPEERMLKRNYVEYKEWRKAIYERDNYLCKCCGEKSSSNLVAHHFFNYGEWREYRLAMWNGITLCKGCHKEFHFIYGNKNNTYEQFCEFYWDFWTE